MRADMAGLDNQLELGQLFDHLTRQVGALADQHNHVGILEPHGQLAGALDGVGVNLGLVDLQLRGAGQFAHGILVVVENHNIHGIQFLFDFFLIH